MQKISRREVYSFLRERNNFHIDLLTPIKLISARSLIRNP